MEKFSYIANSEAAYVEELYQQYRQQPDSVDGSWQRFFEGFEFSQHYGEHGHATNGNGAAVAPAKPIASEQARKEMEVVHLIRGYRSRAHLLANTNPIKPRRDRQPRLELKDFRSEERRVGKEC